MFVLLSLFLILPSNAGHLPSPDFFVKEGEPNVLLVIGKNARAREIILVSSVASRIGEMAHKYEKKERVVWGSEELLDYLYYDDGFLPHMQRFNRGNVALGYTGVDIALGVGGSIYISDPTRYGEYDYIGANSVDGDWGTLTYLASGSFWFWPDDNYFSIEFSEEKEIDRIILKIGHIGNYRLQYGFYDADCGRWIWSDIGDIHEGTPIGPPPAKDMLGNIVGNPAGTQVRKYFFPAQKTKALRLLLTPIDFSGLPHQLYEFQAYGNPFNVLYRKHYFVDFFKGKEAHLENLVELRNLDYWILGILPTQFSDFMETRGHSWKSPPNSYFLFDRHMDVLRLYKNPILKQNLLFFGSPQNHTFDLKGNERMNIDGWSVKLADVDLDERKVAIEIERDSFQRRVFLPVRFKKKIASELFVDSSQNDAQREAMYALDHAMKDNMVFLEFHPDLADPLHDTVLNTTMWWHTQNSTQRALTYWNALSGSPPPPLYPFCVFDGRMLEEDMGAFAGRASESLSSPPVELVVNGDIDGRFVFVSGGFRLKNDFSSKSTQLVLKYIIYERNVLHNGVLHDFVVRGMVEEADTVYQNHTKENWWSYHELRSGEKYLFSSTFDLENCEWNINIDDYKNVGVAVILQRYECSTCPLNYDVPEEILTSSAYDEVRGDYFEPYVVHTEENFYPTFEVTEDLDQDGEKDDVIFAVESVFAGMGEERHATFNAYTLKDYGVLNPSCLFYEDGDAWDLKIDSDPNPQDFVHEGSIRVVLKEPKSVPCAGGCIFKGPKDYFRLTLKEILVEEKYGSEISEDHRFSATHFYIEKTDYLQERVISTNDPTRLLRFDYEVKDSDKKNKNLILFGKDNALSLELVRSGISKTRWEDSAGELEYIEGVWGQDVLIVAGKDSEASRCAILLLMQFMDGLP